jgi:hypothetical protein
VAVRSIRPGRQQAAQHPVKEVLPLVLPFAALVGVAAFVALVAFRSQPAAPQSARGALVWGNGIFANRAELKAWLRQHGASYTVWLEQHPQAAAYMRRRVATRPARATPPPRAVAVARRRPIHAATRPKAGVLAAKATVPRLPAVSASGRGPSRFLTIIFGFFVVLALGASVVPERFVLRNGRAMISAEGRVFIAAAGFATLLGVAAALWIG